MKPLAFPQDLAALDALLADRHSAWWDGFYADRARPVPFFGSAPDECLHEWLGDGLIAPRGTALDLGCGNGRNAGQMKPQRPAESGLFGEGFLWAMLAQKL